VFVWGRLSFLFFPGTGLFFVVFLLLVWVFWWVCVFFVWLGFCLVLVFFLFGFLGSFFAFLLVLLLGGLSFWGGVFCLVGGPGVLGGLFFLWVSGCGFCGFFFFVWVFLWCFGGGNLSFVGANSSLPVISSFLDRVSFPFRPRTSAVKPSLQGAFFPPVLPPL